MANLKLIKDLAQLKGMTIEQLAAKAEITTQSIHLMGRTGKTKMETLEKIAEILEVPEYVFYDDKFDVEMFRDYVVKGHHNPTTFFGPIYNGGEAPFADKAEEEHAQLERDEKALKESVDLLKAKDDMIIVLRKQVEDLMADKAELRAVIQAQRNEIAELKEQAKIANN